MRRPLEERSLGGGGGGGGGGSWFRLGLELRVGLQVQGYINKGGAEQFYASFSLSLCVWQQFNWTCSQTIRGLCNV